MMLCLLFACLISHHIPLRIEISTLDCRQRRLVLLWLLIMDSWDFHLLCLLPFVFFKLLLMSLQHREYAVLWLLRYAVHQIWVNGKVFSVVVGEACVLWKSRFLIL